MKLEIKRETEKLIGLAIGWDQHEYPHRLAPEKITKICFVFLCWVLELKITTEYKLTPAKDIISGTAGVELK